MSYFIGDYKLKIITDELYKNWRFKRLKLWQKHSLSYAIMIKCAKTITDDDEGIREICCYYLKSHGLSSK